MFDIKKINLAVDVSHCFDYSLVFAELNLSNPKSGVRNFKHFYHHQVLMQYWISLEITKGDLQTDVTVK